MRVSERYRDLDDDKKLYLRYRDKKNNSENQQVGFILTFDDYCSLVAEAGIVSSKIGRAKYHLARIKDKGPYEIGNCRFVWYKINLAEKRKPVIDLAYRIKASERSRKYYSENPGPFTGRKHKEESKKLIGAANSIKLAGRGNSQFGTCWITNGVSNTKMKRGLALPNGWKLGRVNVHKNKP